MCNKSVKGFCCENFGVIKSLGHVISDFLIKIHVLLNTKELHLARIFFQREAAPKIYQAAIISITISYYS